MKLEELYAIIEARSTESSDSSYTARLMSEGIDRIAQKVGEEGVEVVIAAKNNDQQLLIGEISDLTYHLLVLMYAKGITPNDIQKELAQRHDKKA